MIAHRSFLTKHGRTQLDEAFEAIEYFVDTATDPGGDPPERYDGRSQEAQP